MELRNKGKLIRAFGTGYIVAIRNKLSSSRKGGKSPKLILKTKGILQIPIKGYNKLILVTALDFCKDEKYHPPLYSTSM